MLRAITAGMELAGYVLIGFCVYLIEPRLLIGVGGVALVGFGIALANALEKAE